MKQAVLVASFGSTHLDTISANVEPAEKAIMAEFPEAAFYRAFTSRIVRKRLKEQYGIETDGVEEALSRIEADGFTEVIIQPTLLIPGFEYEKVCNITAKFAGRLSCKVGRPLLYTPEDQDRLLSIMQESYPQDADTVLLAMGHGTEHSANKIYIELAEKAEQLPGQPIRICTVEGIPDFADGIRELLSLPQRKVHLLPLLLVAGDHAKNDMSGDEPDSLASLLRAEGFSVSFSLAGLGELEAVRSVFAKRALAAAAE